MKKGIPVIRACAGLACASAGSIRVVESEYWKDEHFAAYQGYAWLPSNPRQRASTQVEDHRLHDLIRKAIDERLAQRGFVRTELRDADFLVTYHCKIAEQIETNVIDRVWYSSGDSDESEEVTRRIELSSFDKGSIVIDFVKPSNGKRVWRGVAEGRVSLDAAPEEYEAIVDLSVREILNEFPPAR